MSDRNIPAEFPADVTMRTRSGDERVFTIRRCREDDIDEIMNLQEEIYSRIDNKETYIKTSKEDFLESFELDHCFCAVCGDRISAVTVLVSGRLSPERNYGYYLGYGEDRLGKCFSFDLTMVHPDHRGYGLQAFFCDLRSDVSEMNGSKEALTTISPRNSHSLRNLMDNGFEVVETRTLYSGVERHILRKSFE